MILEGIDRLMELISRSKYIVGLTGAGISTNAGIPDFRGPHGIYSKTNIPGEKLFDIRHFKNEPSFFYKHIGELALPLLEAEPTKGHLFLKKLEDLGKLKTVITQNIDGLHQKAGNTNVIDIHGNMEKFVCLNCKHEVDTNPQLIEKIRTGEVAYCNEFGGECESALKPDIVFFGEPVHGLEKALTEVQKADLLISLGTSLSVYPVAQLPSYITDNAKLAIINFQETPYDEHAQLVIHEDIDLVIDKTKLL